MRNVVRRYRVLSHKKEVTPMPQFSHYVNLVKRRIPSNNTKVYETSEGFAVKLHSTVIVEVSFPLIKLSNGGHVTRTTATRMNQVFEAIGLPGKVFRRDGQMFFENTFTGHVDEFDGENNHYLQIEG